MIGHILPALLAGEGADAPVLCLAYWMAQAATV
jgi:hypothetical protein